MPLMSRQEFKEAVQHGAPWTAPFDVNQGDRMSVAKELGLIDDSKFIIDASEFIPDQRDDDEQE
jgi:hypothetical protein